MSPIELKQAIKAAKRLPRAPKPHTEPEPEQELPPKYIHRINNKLGHRYRAIVRWNRVDYRLGMFDSIPDAIAAQEAKCIELGTTYDEAFNTSYDMRLREYKSQKGIPKSVQLREKPQPKRVKIQ